MRIIEAKLRKEKVEKLAKKRSIICIYKIQILNTQILKINKS